MESLQYTIKPSNLPSDVPLYQPVVDVVHTQELDKVAGVIAQKLGYEKMVVVHVLQNLGISLPELLAAGGVDLGFLTMVLGMTGTVIDPNIVYNSSNAPLTIRVALKKKSNLIEAVRSLIGLQKNPYVPKTVTFTGVYSNRYKLDGFVPMSSSYAITGNNLSLTSKSLFGYVGDAIDTVPTSNGHLFDDVASGTNVRIMTCNPFNISGTYNPNDYTSLYYIRFGIQGDELALSPVYRLVLGGLELLPVVMDNDLVYKEQGYGGLVSTFKLNVDGDGDLVIQWKSVVEATYGAEIKVVTENQELELTDSGTPTPKKLTVYVGAGAIDKYKTAANLSGAFELNGYRE
jgi:hypothetical protein